MQQITSPSVDKLPKVGYLVSNEEKKEKFYKTESHIHKQGPLSGLNAGAHKLTNNVLTYLPKGFAGSKNSDFYEFLSLGMFPYIIGSATLIALYGLTRGKMNLQDAHASGKALKNAAAGVALYGLGKWASPKLAHIGIKQSTGVDLDMLYINKVNEIPENGREKGLVRTQYPGVFSSVDFYRKDLLEKDSELNHGNIYAYNDKIAKKAGFKEKLNAPNQTMGNKIRELKARTTALENVTKYIAAACGVALGAQKAFGEMDFKQLKGQGFLKSIGGGAKAILGALKKACTQLWQGSNKNIITKHAGKALIIGTLVSTLATWLIPSKGFKTNPDTMKAKIDESKEFEVC